MFNDSRKFFSKQILCEFFDKLATQDKNNISIVAENSFNSMK